MADIKDKKITEDDIRKIKNRTERKDSFGSKNSKGGLNYDGRVSG